MKRKLLSLLVLLLTAATGAWADDYTITLPSVSNGSVVAKVSDVSVTSAAAGATVTLEATPDAGYRLKSISGVYETSASKTETLNATDATVNGTKFQAVATAKNLYGWRVYNPGSANTLTISSKDGTNIKKIELTSTFGGKRTNNMLSVTAGTLSFDGSDPSTTVTINNINATSVIISGSGPNAAATWCISSAKIYYEGMVETAVEISDTENANVKIFTMPSGNVTISAAFELAPINLTANEGATGQYWATFFSNASNYQASAGTQVFKVKLTGSAIEMTEITDRIVKSGEGVVLKNTSASITMTPTASNSSDDYSDNSLVGTMTNITNPGNAYVLNKKNGVVGLFKLSDTGTIGANKAYLVYSGSGDAPTFFGFGETTGVNEVRSMMAEGRGDIYNLNGQKVLNPTRGLYIVNGKKVVIK